MLDAKDVVEVGDRNVEGEAGDRSSGRRRTARRTSDPGRKTAPGKGMQFAHRFSTPDRSPFETIEWERRKASITDGEGKVIFEQSDVEVPKTWSMLATNVVASKYFYGAIGSPDREHSVRQLVHRVTRAITDRGLDDGYFASPEDAEAFYNELTFLCLNQYGSFNSPVWFNVGLYDMYGHTSTNRTCFGWDAETGRVCKSEDSYRKPQASACFIQSIEDTMEGIMSLATSEAMLFKYGSGTGTDLSTLRSSREKLSGGGTPSGPLSFMRIFDQVAGAIKSGGKTRRAAKMQSLKVTHPDIVEFIDCKLREEKKAWALIEQGYDGSFSGEAYASVMFQNANTSIRVTDAFMQAVESDGDWTTRAVTTGDPVEAHKAREIMKRIAEGAHLCGDPGIQYDSTINRWHTCKNTAPINASNPCSEYMFVDDSACNLASINLIKFIDDRGCFDTEAFKHAVRIFITAQEILIDNASYPTEKIADNSHRFRPLGLGYANLGALIMRFGLPYDSDAGRALAGAVTALMCGQAYVTSQELAAALGPFDGFAENREAMAHVIGMHREAIDGIDSVNCPPEIRSAALDAWESALSKARNPGFRNAQVTVLAPTGTIGFMMDCDTTGVEPDIALVKYKQLAGGGLMKIVNRTLRPALKRMGYADDQVEAIVKYVDTNDTIEGAPDLNPEHLPVFDCAFKPLKGSRSIHYKAHLRMMAAVQPFLSGAISKTVNMPSDVTANDIAQVYMDGWKMGLKAVAIYRDGSKRIQPLSTQDSSVSKSAAVTELVEKAGLSEEEAEARVSEARRKPFRRRMPPTRQSITHKFEVAGHEGYLTVGMYEDGSPGELFITMAKEGSTVGGTMDAFGTAISLCLQYGVPVHELCQKFAHSRFEPSGFTKNPDIPVAKSLVDYIFRWLHLTFPNGCHAAMAPVAATVATPVATAEPVMPTDALHPGGAGRVDDQFRHYQDDAPACDLCGAITVRNGTCYRCYNCGNSMGCS